MKENGSGHCIPPDIIRTWKILAPQGATLEREIVALNIAVELHRAQAERNIEEAEIRKLDKLYF